MRFTTNHFTAAIVLFSFGLIFVLSIHSCKSAFDLYNDSKPEWPEKKCTAHNATTFACSDNFQFYNYQVNVSVSGWKSPVDVYPRADRNDCHLSRAEAEAKAKAIVSAKNILCYVYEEESRVRLEKGGFPPSELSKRKVRFIFSIISTIILGIIAIFALRRAIFVFVSSRHSPYLPRPQSSHDPSSPYAPPPPTAAPSSMRSAYRRPLSAADANALVASFPRGDHSHPICPICLEDFTSTHDTARLPCDHIYHDACAAQWFRKGSASCPYCNYDLSSDLIALHADKDEEDNSSDSNQVSGEPNLSNNTHPRDPRRALMARRRAERDAIANAWPFSLWQRGLHDTALQRAESGSDASGTDANSTAATAAGTDIAVTVASGPPPPVRTSRS